MSTKRELHRQAKHVFEQACELRDGELAAFLDVACQEDSQLREEVQSLLDYDAGVVKGDLPQPWARSEGDKWQANSTRQTWRTNLRRWLPTAAGLAALALACFALDRYLSSRAVRDAALQAEGIRDAYAAALGSWVEVRKREVNQVASLPAVQIAASQLAQLAQQQTDRDILRESPARIDFYSAVQPYRQHHEQAVVSLVDLTGMIIADPEPAWIGIKVNEHAYGYLAPVFQGETVFIPPHAEGSFTLEVPENVKAKAVRGVHSFVVSPVRDPQGKVVAALACAERSKLGLGKMVNGKTFGRTGEVYLFNQDGVMVTNSHRARRAGKQLTAASANRTELSMVAIELREPGSFLDPSENPSATDEPSPHTSIITKALALASKKHTEEVSGAVLRPYQSYQGQRVIGAWTWLPRLDCGVIAELESAEVFATSTLMRWCLWGSAALVGLVLGGKTVATNLLNNHERRRQVSRLGKYELLEPLGEGGLGVVHRAIDTKLDRIVAIKLLKESEQRSYTRARFQQEAALMSRLMHPHTVTIYDRGVTDAGVPYYVMEYLEGVTLDQLVAREAPLRLNRALRILDQICAAIEEAHSQGTIHRDIKPQNVMICGQGGSGEFVKVLDFGLGKNLDANHLTQITTGQLVAGTIRYMAPECISAPDTVDTRADVYALGGLAYFLLGGKPLFSGQSELKAIHSILHAEIDFTALENGAIPERLVQLIKGCLEKTPGKRPNDGGAMRAILSEISESVRR